MGIKAKNETADKSHMSGLVMGVEDMSSVVGQGWYLVLFYLFSCRSVYVGLCLFYLFFISG
jgi:hypothetical protein